MVLFTFLRPWQHFITTVYYVSKYAYIHILHSRHHNCWLRWPPKSDTVVRCGRVINIPHSGDVSGSVVTVRVMVWIVVVMQ